MKFAFAAFFAWMGIAGWATNGFAFDLTDLAGKYTAVKTTLGSCPVTTNLIVNQPNANDVYSPDFGYFQVPSSGPVMSPDGSFTIDSGDYCIPMLAIDDCEFDPGLIYDKFMTFGTEGQLSVYEENESTYEITYSCDFQK